MCFLSTVVATVNQIHADQLLVGNTNPTASCLDDDQQQRQTMVEHELDHDLQIEQDLLLTGKRYNLPPLLHHETPIPFNWIVHQHPGDDERQHSTFVKIKDCISNTEWDQMLSLKSFLQKEWIMNDRYEDTEHYRVEYRVDSLFKEK